MKSAIKAITSSCLTSIAPIKTTRPNHYHYRRRSHLQFQCLPVIAPNNNSTIFNQRPTSHFFSTTSIIHKDQYEHYRRYNNHGTLPLFHNPQNPSMEDLLLYQELQSDSKQTLSSIIAKLNSSSHNISLEEIQCEIYKKSVRYEKYKESIKEIGPNGQHWYFSKWNGEHGIMTFLRSAKIEGNEEVVLQLNYHEVEPSTSMSLLVDEEFIVYLHVPLQGKEEIRVRHISSGQVYILPIITENDDGSGGSIAQVEFGSKRKFDRTYSIYYTLTNEFNQPCKVYYTHFDPPSPQSIKSTIQEPITIPTKPKLIFQEPNSQNVVDIARSKGTKYVIINSTSKTCNEIHLIDDDSKEGEMELKLVRGRQDYIKYNVECGSSDDEIILLMNCTSATIDSCDLKVWVNEKNGKEQEYELSEEYTVFQTCFDNLPLEHPSSSSSELPPSSCHLTILSKPLLSPKNNDGSHHDPSASEYFIEEIDLFANYLVYYERSSKTGLQRIRVSHKSSQISNIVSLNRSEVSSIQLCGNINYDSTKLYVRMESPVTMGDMFEYDMESDVLTCLNDDDDGMIKSHQDDVVQKRVLIPSKDGTHVPLSLIYPKLQNEKNSETQTLPTILIGYGSYGENQSLSYDPLFVQHLLKRGFSVAYAHTRGGADLGQYWYHAGRGFNKIKAVEDYIACAEALVYDWDRLVAHDEEEDLNVGGRVKLYQIRSKSRDEQNHEVVARAFSAGGILVGAAINQSPSLFSAATLINPYLDLLNTTNNPNLPLVYHEWEEWCSGHDGSKNNDDILGYDKARGFMQLYCPFENLGRLKRRQLRQYPTMFLVGTLDDENVSYWHSVTYSKKLLDMLNSSDNDSDSSEKDNDDAPEGKINQDILLHVEESGGHHLHGRKLYVSSLEIAFLLGRYPRITEVSKRFKENNRFLDWMK